MIPQSRAPKQVKEDFLEKNSKFHEIKDKNPSVGEFFNIGDDDEVWIMQCPKGADLSALKDQKLKLPGRSTQDNFETVAVEYAQPVQHAFGYKNRKGHNGLKILPVRGSIVLRTRLSTVNPPEGLQSEAKQVRVPMPTGIKERHPLHGVNYKPMLELNQEIAERLKRADNTSVNASSKKSKRKSEGKAQGTIPVDSDGDVELVMQKKAKKKKKKRTISNGDEPEEVSPKKKKKKNSQSLDEVAAGLQWINKL